MILGHEFAGEVVEIGEGVTNVQIGERVSPDACWHCGTCYMCKRNRYSVCEKLAFTDLMVDGAFAEYVNVPAYTLYKLPPEIPSDIGALIEPIAVFPKFYEPRETALWQAFTWAYIPTAWTFFICLLFPAEQR